MRACRKRIKMPLFLILFLVMAGVSFGMGGRAEAAQKPVLVGVSNEAQGVVFRWKRMAKADGYLVFRKTGNGAFKKIANLRGNTVTSYTDKTVISGQKYAYSLRAYQGKKKSGYDKSGLSIQYLSAPVISGLKKKDASVTVSWRESAGAAGYYVYRRSEGGSFAKIAKVKAGKNSYEDTGAPGGNTQYAVIARSGKTASAVCKKKMSAPSLSAPALKSLSVGTEGLNLTWSAAANAQGYYVYRKTESSSWKRIGSVGESGKSSYTYTDTAGTVGTKYAYTVRAYCKGAISGYNKGLKAVYAKYQSAGNSGAAYAIEADVKVTGSGSGYHAKLIFGSASSAVSFGLQYDAAGPGIYQAKTALMIENIISNSAGNSEKWKNMGKSNVEFFRMLNGVVQQHYAWVGLGESGRTFHLMLEAYRNGDCKVYVNGILQKTVNNPGLQRAFAAGEDVSLRVEGSGRTKGAKISAEFSDIQLKINGVYEKDRAWNASTYDSAGAGIHSDISKYKTSRKVTIGGVLGGIGSDEDWDSAYGSVSGLTIFYK